MKKIIIICTAIIVIIGILAVVLIGCGETGGTYHGFGKDNTPTVTEAPVSSSADTATSASTAPAAPAKETKIITEKTIIYVPAPAAPAQESAQTAVNIQQDAVYYEKDISDGGYRQYKFDINNKPYYTGYRKDVYGNVFFYTAPQPVPSPSACPTPSPSPSTPVTDLNADGKKWEILSNGTMNWIGPKDGSNDIHQALGDWLDYIRANHSATFTTTCPGRLTITTGRITGNGVDKTFDGGPNELCLTAGSYTVSYSSGSSGGFRWTPAQGYGWRK